MEFESALVGVMNGGDNTVLGGLISAATLITLHYVVAFATLESKRLEAGSRERQRRAQGPGRAAGSGRWQLHEEPGRATSVGVLGVFSLVAVERVDPVPPRSTSL